MSDEVARILGDWYADDGKDPEALIRKHPELAAALRSHFAVLGPMDDALGNDSALPEGTPERIGDYKILRELGRGGMGVVYEAEQISLKRRVALKVVSLSFTSSPQALSRFEREARAAGRLHHTNIVPIYALGQHEGYCYYAMELVHGRPLNTVIASLKHSKKPGEETLARLMSESSGSRQRTPSAGAQSHFHRIAAMFAGVAEALDAAHREGIIHRDIKPSNLLLDVDGTLKIVDFGLARTAEEGPALTITGDLLGTPIYMSPEQAMVKRVEIDHRIDVYSFGATLYEVLTLRPPFEGDTLQSILSQIISADPVAPHRRNARIPKDLETIVLKAMEKDRDKRYTTAGALARDLRRFSLGEAIQARRAGPLGRVWRRVKRHRTVSSLVAASLLLAVGLAFWAHRASVEAEGRNRADYERLLGQAQEAMASHRAFAQEIEGSGPAVSQAHARRLLDRAVALVPDRPGAYWLRSMAAGRSRAERFADVEAAGRRGLPHRTYHMTRAHLMEGAGLWSEAEAEQALARGEQPTPDSAYFEGKILHASGHRREALEALTRAIEATAHGGHIRFLALRARAWTYEDIGDLSAALKDLHAVQDAGHDTIGVRVRIASLWHRLGNEATAERRFGEILSDVRRAGSRPVWVALCSSCADSNQNEWLGRASKEAVAAYPEASGPARQRVRYLAEAGQLEEALRVCHVALKRNEDHHPLTGEKARVLLQMGEHEQALKFFRKARALSSTCYHCAIGHGRTLYRLERFEEELKVYAEAIALNPRNPVAHYNSGVTLYQTAQRKEAEQAYRRALKSDASYVGAMCNLSTLLYERDGASLEALELTEKALTLRPDEAIYHVNHGNLLLAGKQVDAAEKAYSRAIEIAPEMPEGWNNRGSLRLNIRDDAAAALPDFRKAAALAPDDPKAVYNIGLTLNKLREFADARLILERATQLDERNADAFNQLGDSLYFGLGDFKQAHEMYSRSIELEPTANNLVSRGNLLHDDLHSPDKALLDFQKALALDPTHFIAQRNCGIALRSLHRYEQAIQAFDKALAMKEEAPFVHRMRALCFVGLEEYDAALAAYDRGLKAKPAAILHNYKGMLLNDTLHDSTRALLAFDEAIRMKPQQWVYRVNRAKALRSLGRTEDALAALAEASRLQPRNAMPQNERGELFLGLGQYDRALEAYRNAIQIAPQWSRPYWGMMHLLGEAGRYEEGLKESRKANARFPKDIYLREALVTFLRATGGAEEASGLAKQWTTGEIPERWLGCYAHLCAAAGDDRKARQTLARETDCDAEGYYFRAITYTALGDVEAAIECLEKALAGGYRRAAHAVHDPELTALEDERAKALLGKFQRDPEASAGR